MSSALLPRTPTPHPFQTLRKSIDYTLFFGSQQFWVVLNWGAFSKANINQHIYIYTPSCTHKPIHHFNKTLPKQGVHCSQIIHLCKKMKRTNSVRDTNHLYHQKSKILWS